MAFGRKAFQAEDHGGQNSGEHFCGRGIYSSIMMEKTGLAREDQLRGRMLGDNDTRERSQKVERGMKGMLGTSSQKACITS